MYKQEVFGEGCIVARIVADSIHSETGKRITTFELEYPRFIHGEFMTHRQLSRNAMSSRAVPVKKMIEQVRDNPARPIHWGKNQSGMQAKETLSGSDLTEAIFEWDIAAKQAANSAEFLDEIGAHKQLVNRILEPFQVMKTVVTATEWGNFFYLRDHQDAQPEIAELARCMKTACDQNTPEKLKVGEWHLPYVVATRNINTGDMMYGYYEVPTAHDNAEWFFEMALEDAQKVSASCCAQVSFRQSDTSIDKAKRIYDMLVESKPVHASPFEHASCPMKKPQADKKNWEEGVTHADLNGDCWSGNFKHWIQYRQLIKDHVVKG